MPDTPESNIIIYNTLDGKAAVALYAKTGKYGSTKYSWRNFLPTLHPISIYTYPTCW